MYARTGLFMPGPGSYRMMNQTRAIKETCCSTSRPFAPPYARFGLTGAYYSSDAKRIDYAGCEFHVGNLYFNRKCTGALVGIHPFGGFNMSSTDSKGSGPDYLLLFSQAKSIGERLKPKTG
jgi:hypothetical protein